MSENRIVTGQALVFVAVEREENRGGSWGTRMDAGHQNRLDKPQNAPSRSATGVTGGFQHEINTIYEPTP